MQTPSAASNTSAGRREWIALAVLALPCMLVTMDLTVLFLAVPALTVDLDPSSSQLLWITDIYGFLIAGALITMGTLGDRTAQGPARRSRAFGAASVLAALSTSPRCSSQPARFRASQAQRSRRRRWRSFPCCSPTRSSAPPRSA